MKGLRSSYFPAMQLAWPLLTARSMSSSCSQLRSDALTSKRRGRKSCHLRSPEAGFPVQFQRRGWCPGLCTGSVHEGSNPSPTLGCMIRAKLPILLPKSMERFPIHPPGQSKISANGIDARYPEAFRVPGHLCSWDWPREDGLASLGLEQTRAHVVTRELAWINRQVAQESRTLTCRDAASFGVSAKLAHFGNN